MRRSERGQRRGLAIIPALVCLTIVALLCAAMLRLAHTQRLAAREEQGRMQAEWLAESGADRASARLGSDPSYRGETWLIAAERLGGNDNDNDAARVVIAVEPVADRPDRRRVRVEAEYPAGATVRARQSRQFLFTLPKPNEKTPGGSS